MSGFFSGYNDTSFPDGSTNDAARDYERQNKAAPGGFGKPSFFDRLFGGSPQTSPPGSIQTTPLPPPAQTPQPAAPLPPKSPPPAISSGQSLISRILKTVGGPPTHTAAGQALVPGTSMTTEQFMEALKQAAAPPQMSAVPPGFNIPGMGHPAGSIPGMAQQATMPQPPQRIAAPPNNPMMPNRDRGRGAFGLPPQGLPFAPAMAPPSAGPQMAAMPSWQPQVQLPPQQAGFFRGGPLHMMRGGYPASLMMGMPMRHNYAHGDYVQPDGHGDGRSDHVDAKLSPGEFVMDAETVSLLGNGDNSAGARQLEGFRKNVRQQKGRALAKGKFSPDAKSPESYLRGGK